MSWLDMVGHACNPSYFGGIGIRIGLLSEASSGQKLKTLFKK
jgi:hypothetical protein